MEVSCRAVRNVEHKESLDEFLVLQPYAVNMQGSDFQNFSYNNDGRCGSVAAAILLCYYDDNGYSSLVSATHCNDEVAFTDYLYDHIEGVSASEGSSTSDLVSGLTWYIREESLGAWLGVRSRSVSSYVTYKTQVNTGTPVILDLDNDPRYSEHWVVGYNYETIGSSDYATVVDGHGDDEALVNWDYVDDSVYLEELRT